MRYVLRRSDGKFVARPGSQHSYTDDITKAQFFAEKEESEQNRCPENESVVCLGDNPLSFPPSNCPNCNGQREWAGTQNKGKPLANCYFCGYF